MIHQGYCLKIFIEEGGEAVNEIAKVLGVSRQGIYNLYGQVKLDKTYHDKLQKAGYKIKGITVEGGIEIGESASAKKEIDMLKQLLRAKDELIEALRGNK